MICSRFSPPTTPPDVIPSSFTYLKLNLQDTAREDISSAFYDALDFIDAALTQGGTVFVHCQHGVSRSATIVVAYLMWRQRLTYDDTLDAVRAVRPTINPNIGFACSRRNHEARDEAHRTHKRLPELGVVGARGGLRRIK